MPKLIEMMEAGVHFGHKKERSHPKAKDFIFTLREGIFIIDLDQTNERLEKALSFLKKEIDEGRTVLFVGTKRQAREMVKNLAKEADAPYITQRWLGGTLTNFETIKKNIKELERLEEQVKTQEFVSLTKKEQKVITDKLAKLQEVFGGIRNLKSLPDALFIVDAHHENLAVMEANRMKIPVVAICDTDSDPTKITYPIPANDDAAKSLELIMGEVEKAVLGSLIKKTEKTTDDSKKHEETKEEKVVDLKPVKETKEIKKAEKITKTKKTVKKQIKEKK